jgi:hypothetical protein
LENNRTRQRWDLILGAAASIIAILGLSVSRSGGNSLILGDFAFSRELQGALRALGTTFLLLVQ